MWTHIDSVMVLPNGKAYLFSGNEYVRYDIAADRVDPGYPARSKPTGEVWAPGRSRRRLAERQGLLLPRREYLRYDIAADKVDDGYPHGVGGNWRGLSLSLVTAADRLADEQRPTCSGNGARTARAPETVTCATTSPRTGRTTATPRASRRTGTACPTALPTPRWPGPTERPTSSTAPSTSVTTSPPTEPTRVSAAGVRELAWGADQQTCDHRHELIRGRTEASSGLNTPNVSTAAIFPPIFILDPILSGGAGMPSTGRLAAGARGPVRRAVDESSTVRSRNRLRRCFHRCSRSPTGSVAIDGIWMRRRTK